MPRKARITVAGAVHHIMSRGIEGTSIFLDDDDRRIFISIIESLLLKVGYLLYAWCLMDNHYHILVRVNEYPLGSFIRLLNGGYAHYFRKKSGKRGYLFQDRYKSIVTQDQKYIEELVRYVHLNPIRAGICRLLDDLEKYEWSGHPIIIGKKDWCTQNIRDVLGRFASDFDTARKKYREFLHQGIESNDETTELVRNSNEQSENIFHTGCWVIGNKDFVTSALHSAHENRIRIARYAKEGIAIEDLAQKIASKHKISCIEMQRRGRNSARSIARKELAFSATREYHFSVMAIARFLGTSSPAVSRMVADFEGRKREMGY